MFWVGLFVFPPHSNLYSEVAKRSKGKLLKVTSPRDALHSVMVRGACESSTNLHCASDVC